MGQRMIIERDVSIPTSDGLVLKADVFRPSDAKPGPVIVMTLGPYGKGVPYSVGYAPQWKWLTSTYPNLLPGSSKEYMVWETVDPEIWVNWGYICIRVDSRGSGRSPGHLEIFSRRETQDYCDAIERVADQPWSTGKVGLNGISYYAITWLNERASGPDTKSAEELKATRSDPVRDFLSHALDDGWYQSPDWSKVITPFLNATNWAGFGLHPRGNFEAFTQAASKQKWLECHAGQHEEWFYLERGMALQKKFLDHFLKGVDNGWDKEPPVLLHQRRPFSTEFEPRTEQAWPLPNTRWSRMYLAGHDSTLSWEKPAEEAKLGFKALEEPLTFHTPPLETETEIIGPLSAKVFASSSTEDMDLFITLQAFAPDGREVNFQGNIDPHTPLAPGWLRASHRKLDKTKSLPHRPYHTHDELQPLTPGEIYELDIEIWPTHIILPAGYRIALQISGKDFQRPLPPDSPNEAWVSRGSGPFLHTLPEDRPNDVFGGETTIFTGGSKVASFVLLPIIESPS